MNVHSVKVVGTFECQSVSSVPIWEPSHEGRLVYVSDINTFYFADNIQYNIVKQVRGEKEPSLKSRELDINLNSNFYIYPDSMTLLYSDTLSTEKNFIFDNKLQCLNIKNYLYSIYSMFTIPKTYLLNTDTDFYIIYSVLSNNTDYLININIELYNSEDLLNIPFLTYENIELPYTDVDAVSIIALNKVTGLQFSKLPDILGVKIVKPNDDFIGNIKILGLFLRQNNVKFNIFDTKSKSKFIVSDISKYDLNSDNISYCTEKLSNNDNGFLFLTSLWDSTSAINITLPTPSPGTFFSIRKDKRIRDIKVGVGDNTCINGISSLKIRDTSDKDSLITFIATGIYDYQIKYKDDSWFYNIIDPSYASAFFSELSNVFYINRNKKSKLDARASLTPYTDYYTNTYYARYYFNWSGSWSRWWSGLLPHTSKFINPTKSYSTPTIYKTFSQVDPFFGINIGKDLNLYCIPFNSTTIFKINLADPEYGDSEYGNFSGVSKWAGGVLAPDGSIYCIPYNSSEILKINPGVSQTYSLFGSSQIDNAPAKWCGGVLGPDGNIYGIPYNSSTILKIIPGDIPIISFISLPESIRTGDGKWYGGTLAIDGNIYCSPYNSPEILKIDSINNQISNFGNFSGDTKWCGAAVSEEGYINFTPYSYNKILQIDVKKTVPTTKFINLTESNSYQSSVLGLDGLIYSFPTSNKTFLANYLDDGYCAIPLLPDPSIPLPLPTTSGEWYYSATVYCYPAEDQRYRNNFYNDNSSIEAFYKGSILAPDGNIYMIRSDGNVFKYIFKKETYSKTLSSSYLTSAYLNKL